MKIVTFKVNIAVADFQTREAIADAIRKACINPVGGLYGVEILDLCPEPSTVPMLGGEPRQKRKYTRRANDPDKEEPRQKRKYTRRVKVPASDGKEEIVKEGATPIRRVKLEGKVVEMRGNCQGGNAKSQEV